MTKMPHIVDWAIMASRPDFTYSKFLEESFHADQIALSVSQSTLDNIASREQLAERGFELQRDTISSIENAEDSIVDEVRFAANTISDAINNASDEIVYATENVESAISELHTDINRNDAKILYSIQDGNFLLRDTNTKLFSLSCMLDQRLLAVSAKLGTINYSLKELISIAKTPSQTWAFEQFEIARHAVRRGLFDDAIEALDMAINGYMNNVGNRLEHRFYMLLGAIYLGGIDSYSANHVDLDKAIVQYNLARKYAKGVTDEDYAKATLMAGWAQVCSSRQEEAIPYFRECVELYSYDAEAHYLLAKVFIETNRNVSNVIDFLASAMMVNPEYALKAHSDRSILEAQKSVNVINEAIDVAKIALATFQNTRADQYQSALSELEKIRTTFLARCNECNLLGSSTETSQNRRYAIYRYDLVDGVTSLKQFTLVDIYELVCLGREELKLIDRLCEEEDAVIAAINVVMSRLEKIERNYKNQKSLLKSQMREIQSQLIDAEIERDGTLSDIDSLKYDKSPGLAIGGASWIVVMVAGYLFILAVTITSIQSGSDMILTIIGAIFGAVVWTFIGGVAATLVGSLSGVIVGAIMKSRGQTQLQEAKRVKREETERECERKQKSLRERLEEVVQKLERSDAEEEQRKKNYVELATLGEKYMEMIAAWKEAIDKWDHKKLGVEHGSTLRSKWINNKLKSVEWQRKQP